VNGFESWESGMPIEILLCHDLTPKRVNANIIEVIPIRRVMKKMKAYSSQAPIGVHDDVSLGSRE
jgi:hypothetical protein